MKTERMPVSEQAADADWLSIRDRAVNETLLEKGKTLPVRAPLQAAVAGGTPAASREAAGALSALVSRCTVCGGEEEPDQALLALCPQLVLLLAGGRPPRPETLHRLRESGSRIAAWTAGPADETEARAGGRLPDEVLAACDYLFLADSSRERGLIRSGGPAAFELPPAANLPLYAPDEPGEAYRSEVLVLGAEAVEAGRLARILQPMAMRVPGRRLLLLNGGDLPPVMGWRQVEAAPQEAARYVNGAAVVVNLAPDEATGRPNARTRYLQRLYDAAACGVLLLTPYAPELMARYAPGQEIAAYASVEELVQLTAHYLEEEEERRSLALAALRRTWRCHTGSERMEQLLLSACPDLSLPGEGLSVRGEAVSRFGFPLEPAPAASAASGIPSRPAKPRRAAGPVNRKSAAAKPKPTAKPKAKAPAVKAVRKASAAQGKGGKPRRKAAAVPVSASRSPASRASASRAPASRASASRASASRTPAARALPSAAAKRPAPEAIRKVRVPASAGKHKAGSPPFLAKGLSPVVRKALVAASPRRPEPANRAKSARKTA
ncbi:glycosyltransferase family protein [Gorillibacterium sp. sgz500922]|uniref:glycosyltransferase family protein n=1 Tax=Gorillibacterium sp. sgz500922 TaxID=3446694 RepID=UPI003F66AD62